MNRSLFDCYCFSELDNITISFKSPGIYGRTNSLAKPESYKNLSGLAWVKMQLLF
jgi:hypothetical protein